MIIEPSENNVGVFLEMVGKFFNVDWNVNFRTAIRGVLGESSELVVVYAVNLRE